MGKCAAVEAPNANWSFCPNLGAAYLFAVIFGLNTILHIGQAVYHRKGYCWVICMSALWQTLAYAFRITSIKQPNSDSWYSAWFVLILVAPLWTNAFVYMVMGRMVYNFTEKARIFGVKAWRFGLYFVLLDIIAFLIQVGGASYASGDKPEHQVLLGLHIYMGGVGFQQAFILLFLFLAIRFHGKLKREVPTERTADAFKLLYTLYAVLVLITIRIIFRLIEYSKGIKSTIPNHEAYQYVFDSLMMFIALVLFNVIHPGCIMPGKESDFPSRKQRKAYKGRSVGNGQSMLPSSAQDLNAEYGGTSVPMADLNEGTAEKPYKPSFLAKASKKWRN